MKFIKYGLASLIVATLFFAAIAPALAAKPSTSELIKLLRDNPGGLSKSNAKALLKVDTSNLSSKNANLVNHSQKLLKLIAGKNSESNSEKESDDDNDDSNNNNNNNGIVSVPFFSYPFAGGASFSLIPPANTVVPNTIPSTVPNTLPSNVGQGYMTVVAGTGQSFLIPAPPYNHNMAWGSFGTYQNWASQFFAVHGRYPTVQDEMDFWASQVYAGVFGVSPFGAAPYFTFGATTGINTLNNGQLGQGSLVGQNNTITANPGINANSGSSAGMNTSTGNSGSSSGY